MSKGSCIEDPPHLLLTVTCQTNQVSGEQNADYLLLLKKIIYIIQFYRNYDKLYRSLLTQPMANLSIFGGYRVFNGKMKFKLLFHGLESANQSGFHEMSAKGFCCRCSVMESPTQTTNYLEDHTI